MATMGGPRSGQSGSGPSAENRFWTVVIIAIVVLASVVVTVAVVETVDGGVVFTVQADKTEYLPGELVAIRVEFVNRGDDSVDLTFNSSLVSAFSVYDSSGALVCAIRQIALWWIVHETLEPGETLVGGCDWHQIDDEGSQVPHPDSYTIVAGALCLERNLSARTTVFVTG